MDRRVFLQQASLLAAGAPLFSCAFVSSATAVRYPMGYQLFSVRDAMAADPLATMRALAEMGFAHFEAYGYDAKADRLYGFAPAELQRHLDELGTPITSAHFGFADYLRAPEDELRRYVDACLTAAETLDLRYLVWPIVRADDRTLEGFQRLSERLNLIGEQVVAAGRKFAFHNNGGEFGDLGGGLCGYDVVLAEADPTLVRLQLDMYWLAHDSPYTPMEMIARQPGRFEMWHVKDMHPVSRDYTELGAGTIDYKVLMPDPQVSGLELMYLEQGGNFAESSMASAATNAQFWRRHLARRLR